MLQMTAALITATTADNDDGDGDGDDHDSNRRRRQYFEFLCGTREIEHGAVLVF